MEEVFPTSQWYVSNSTEQRNPTNLFTFPAFILGHSCRGV